MNFLLPHLFAMGGFNYVATALATCCAISGLCANWIPARTGRVVKPARNPFRTKNATLPIFACFICLVYATGTMSLWAFLGQLGGLKGVPATQLGALLGAASLLNGVGSLAGTAMGARFGRLLPVSVALSVSLASLTLIGLGNGPTTFIIATLMFSAVNNLASLYYLSSAASVDETGQFMAVASAAFSSGAIIGPPIAGRLIEHQGLQSMVLMPAVIWTVSFGLFVLFHIIAGRERGKTPFSEPRELRPSAERNASQGMASEFL
jgi:predicted MFS family arabinose efflux permease